MFPATGQAITISSQLIGRLGACVTDSLQQQYVLADELVAALSDHQLDLAVLLADLALTGPEGRTIRASMPRSATPKQECVQLIRTGLRYPNGLDLLQQVLEVHLGQTSCWKDLEAGLVALTPASPGCPSSGSSVPPPSTQKVYISYAWGDATPEGQRRGALADDLCNAMKAAGITVLKDRDQVQPGDRISAFMKKLAKGDQILVVLSDRYLTSENCMFELYNIWTRAAHDPEQFLKRVIPLTLPDAQIRTTRDKVNRGLYWQKQKDDLEASGGLNVMGTITFEKFNLIKQFCQHTADMLTLLMDKNEPRDFDRQAQEGFREVLDQILAARAAADG